MPIRLAGKDIHPETILGDQDIVAQAGQASIEGELTATIITFSRGGDDLEDETGLGEDIPALVEHVLAALPAAPADSLDALRDADARARRLAGEAIDSGVVA